MYVNVHFHNSNRKGIKNTSEIIKDAEKKNMLTSTQLTEILCHNAEIAPGF